MVGVPAATGGSQLGSTASVLLMLWGLGLVGVTLIVGQGVPALCLAVLVLLGLGLLVRVRALDNPEPSFWVTTEGIVCDGVTIPWTSIHSVERTSLLGLSRDLSTSLSRSGGFAARDLLALRIVEFDGIQGLRPEIVGLANLQRERRVVLAGTDELFDAIAVAQALDLLLNRPELREVLETQRAEHLFLTGALA